MQGPEKNSYIEFDNEKNSCGSKIPLPSPHNFSNGPSLNARLARAHFILVFSHDTLFRWTICIRLLDQKGSFNGSRRSK